jgi:hypothetical protein
MSLSALKHLAQLHKCIIDYGEKQKKNPAFLTRFVQTPVNCPPGPVHCFYSKVFNLITLTALLFVIVLDMHPIIFDFILIVGC